MGRFDYQPSLGPAQYRRTIYAFWRRSSAPTFLFDSAQRRVCEVGVRRTNTPLHALTLMNDVTMLEASRVLADGIVAKLESKQLVDQQAGLQKLAEHVLSRTLTPAELGDLEAVWQTAIETFRSKPDRAMTFCTVGQQEAPTLEVAPALRARQLPSHGPLLHPPWLAPDRVRRRRRPARPDRASPPQQHAGQDRRCARLHAVCLRLPP